MEFCIVIYLICVYNLKIQLTTHTIDVFTYILIHSAFALKTNTHTYNHQILYSYNIIS